MCSEHPNRFRTRGFTLIETVVALAIVSLGMTAVFMQLNQFATNAIYLRDKTLASWIGSNTVTELSIQASWPELGDEEIEVLFAERDWIVTIAVSETDVENLRRADVAVALSDRPDRIIHSVSGLIEPPAPNGFPPVSWSFLRQGPEG
jgi:general secretion pathway protein I